VPSVPFAHETWFESGHRALDWSFAGQGATLALLGVALALTLAVRLLSRGWNGVDVPWLGRLAPWMPFAVRMHLAVSLIGLLSLGVYLSPAMDLEWDVAGVILGAQMVVVAVLMATGYRTREAALLLIALGPLGMLEFGVAPVLQRLDLLGLAAYVLLAGPGRWSADHERGAAADPAFADHARAILALKLCVGGALIVVAFYEKLANPDLALAFLRDHPHFNVAQEIGLNWTDLQFIRVAGAIEVLFGLFVISGAMPQVAVVAAGIPFNATLFFFGMDELVGHLPVYGAMLVLLVYGSDPRLREATRALGRLDRRDRRAVGDRLAFPDREGLDHA
jgi:hypothetical protein